MRNHETLSEIFDTFFNGRPARMDMSTPERRQKAVEAIAIALTNTRVGGKHVNNALRVTQFINAYQACEAQLESPNVDQQAQV